MNGWQIMTRRAKQICTTKLNQRYLTNNGELLWKKKRFFQL